MTSGSMSESEDLHSCPWKAYPNVYIYMERSTIFNGKIYCFYGILWPFSIAMLNYQRVSVLKAVELEALRKTDAWGSVNLNLWSLGNVCL